jgi:hypothetical protein
VPAHWREHQQNRISDCQLLLTGYNAENYSPANSCRVTGKPETIGRSASLVQSILDSLSGILAGHPGTCGWFTLSLQE